MIVDVVDGGREDFVFEIVENLGRCFGVRAPLDFQQEVVRGDSASFAFVADALVD